MKQEDITVEFDLAKNVFQVQVIGSDGSILVRRKLRRAEVIGFFGDLLACRAGVEACGSALKVGPSGERGNCLKYFGQFGLKGPDRR